MAADKPGASCAVDRRLDDIEDAIVSMALQLGVHPTIALQAIVKRTETRLVGRI